MITLTIDRTVNAGEHTGVAVTFSFTFTGPTLAMIPQSTFNSLVGLDAAITKAIADNNDRTPPAEDGSVTLTADDVTNLNADIDAKAERVATIGHTAPVPVPAEQPNG